MLTIRENFMETIKGGNPDRFVKQYEYQEWACEKTQVFSCVLLLMNTTVVIVHKKAYNSPYPIRKVIMKFYAAVTAFFCLL